MGTSEDISANFPTARIVLLGRALTAPHHDQRQKDDGQRAEKHSNHT